MTRKAAIMIATSFVVSTDSTAALAVSMQTTATADKDARTSVRTMHKDQHPVEG